MKNQTWWVRSGIGLVLGLSLLSGGYCATATAQGFRGGDRGGGFGGGGGGGTQSPEESFRRMDRNQNGQIDPDELGFMRDMFSRAGLDVSRPISQQEFIQGSQQVRQQFEQARSSGDFSQLRITGGGGGPPSFGGGTPSFGGGPPGGFRPEDSERRPDESSDRNPRRDDRDRREDRDSDRRSDVSSSSKSSKKPAKPKVRVTNELPADYREKDKNGDGQIGLYEWDRKAFTQFFDLDRNGDGLLTADELLAAAKKSSTSSSSSTTVALSSSPRSPSTTELAKPNAAAAPTPTSPAPPVEMTAGMKVFVGLDTNRDGTLTDEEWQRSRTARGKFEKAGIAISFPIQQAQFVEMYKQVEAQ